MTKREKIKEIALSTGSTAEAIKLIESIGKELRRENSININRVVDTLRIMTKR